MSTENHLLSEFPPSTSHQWHEAAEALLKGVSFEKKLLTRTYEGLTLQPIYWAQDIEDLPQCAHYPGFAPYTRGTSTSGHKQNVWEIAQECRNGLPEALHATLRDALQHGQTAVSFRLDRAGRQGQDPDQAAMHTVGVAGVSLATRADMQAAFAQLPLETLPILVNPGAAALPFAALLLAHFQQQSWSYKNLQGCIGPDALGMLAADGTLPYSLAAAYDMAAAMTRWARQEAPQLRTLLVDGTIYHEGGASAVQELACIVATGVDYMRAMQTRGLGLNEVGQHIQFTLTVGSEYFLEIAKLRAARVLWAKIVKACGGNPEAQKMHIHVRTSLRNKTLRDPYVNLLRTTIEAFAGVIGGCESLHVGSFDAVGGKSDNFSGRIARNTQIILHEEAHVHEVIDPVGGSWYGEWLTDQLAREAWQLFQSIERRGGMGTALETGFLQEQLTEISAQRRDNLATRKDVLVGTNLYANLDDRPLKDGVTGDEAFYQARLEAVRAFKAGRPVQTSRRQSSKDRDMPDLPILIEAASQGATLGELMHMCCPQNEKTPQIPPITPQRPAEMFERLRAATDAYTAKTGARPNVFMATMGPLKQHKARADFSQGFFEVAGFEMITNYGFHSVEEAAEAAITSRAPVVVICSTDDTYPELVPALTQRIKSVNPETIVVLAGYPGDYAETYRQSGVNEFIHVRANVYDILARILQTLGVT